MTFRQKLLNQLSAHSARLGVRADGDGHEQTTPLIVGFFRRLPKSVEEPRHNSRISERGDYRCQSESVPSPDQESFVETVWFRSSCDKTLDSVDLPANKRNSGRITEEFLV